MFFEKAGRWARLSGTQGYLEDFKSDNAVKHHNAFSPLSRFKVRKQRKGTDRVSRRDDGKQKKDKE